jgi:cell wall-associated NlpC family hydrolase
MRFRNRFAPRLSLSGALLCAVMLASVGLVDGVWAQTANAAPQPGTPAPAAPAATAASDAARSADNARDLSWLPADLIPRMVSNTTTANSGGSAAPAESADPVMRFLNDKGLLPDTRPVVQMAQQVRSKATDVASDLVISAMTFLGVPYRRGGMSRETGFDCSGFTRHVFENTVGLILPRRAIEQANSPDLVPVAKTELKPGDLVFFNTLRNTFSHVGIYIGDNKFIHSPRTGAKVRIEDIREAYWQRHYEGARRAPGLGPRAAAAATAAAN